MPGSLFPHLSVKKRLPVDANHHIVLVWTGESDTLYVAGKPRANRGNGFYTGNNRRNGGSLWHRRNMGSVS